MNWFITPTYEELDGDDYILDDLHFVRTDGTNVEWANCCTSTEDSISKVLYEKDTYFIVYKESRNPVNRMVPLCLLVNEELIEETNNRLDHLVKVNL